MRTKKKMTKMRATHDENIMLPLKMSKAHPEDLNLLSWSECRGAFRVFLYEIPSNNQKSLWFQFFVWPVFTAGQLI